jgi:NDP-sugar pyrophosphorylase family protein
MNGDVLTALDYGAFVRRHRQSGALATIATRMEHVEVSLGVLYFADEQDESRVTDYVEKPGLDFEASMGVYCFDPAVLEHIEPSARLDLPDLVLRLVRPGILVRADAPTTSGWTSGAPRTTSRPRRTSSASRIACSGGVAGWRSWICLRKLRLRSTAVVDA